MLCKVDGCGRDARYKGDVLCQKHYFRVRRNGSTDVKKTARPRIEDKKGYQYLYAPNHPLVPDGQFYVAEQRIVLYQAIGDAPMTCEICMKQLTWKTCCVDHIDENPRNNDRLNLRPTCNSCNRRRSKKPAHTWSHTTSITFDGITQTAHEWSFDPRVKVRSKTIRDRKKAGMSDIEALFGAKRTHNGMPTPASKIRQERRKQQVKQMTKELKK